MPASVQAPKTRLSLSARLDDSLSLSFVWCTKDTLPFGGLRGVSLDPGSIEVNNHGSGALFFDVYSPTKIHAN
jgi:hypothetical protein